MKTVTILKGLPASGKTTWAKTQVESFPGKYKRINKDDLRAMLDAGKWSKENEKFIIKTRNALILSALDEGKHVIVDDTNLHEKHENAIRALVNGIAEVEVILFEITPEEAIKRDLNRPNSVGKDVIMRMYNQFLKPEVEQYVGKVGNPEAYIFDVDGTLAKMVDRGPYDWGKVLTDQVKFNVLATLLALHTAGKKIIIFTGRDGVCEDDTKEWLSRCGIIYDHFDIRPEGNTEKDAVIKKRMFDKIKDKYNVMGVFDDRDQVVEMWRSIGLTCFQVDYGDF